MQTAANAANQPVQHGGGGGGGGAFEFQTIKSYLEGIKHDVEQVQMNVRSPGGLGNCPDSDNSCLSLTLFLVVIAVQTVLFMVYFLLKGTGEKAKFY